MSGLAALLARRHPPGVYRWSARSSSVAVRHTVEHVGWRFVYLDTWTVDDADGFLETTAQAFGRPDEAGRDWDGLAATLGAALPADDVTGTVVLWDGWSPLARTEPESFAAALRTFRQRVDDSSGGGPLVVLLRGQGPSVDVPEVR